MPRGTILQLGANPSRVILAGCTVIHPAHAHRGMRHSGPDGECWLRVTFLHRRSGAGLPEVQQVDRRRVGSGFWLCRSQAAPLPIMMAGALPVLKQAVAEAFLMADKKKPRTPSAPGLFVIQTASTRNVEPSTAAIFTRVPAGRSGPATRHTVSSSRTRPKPFSMACSSVAVRPTSCSVRRLRSG